MLQQMYHFSIAEDVKSFLGDPKYYDTNWYIQDKKVNIHALIVKNYRKHIYKQYIKEQNEDHQKYLIEILESLQLKSHREKVVSDLKMICQDNFHLNT